MCTNVSTQKLDAKPFSDMFSRSGCMQLMPPQSITSDWMDHSGDGEVVKWCASKKGFKLEGMKFGNCNDAIQLVLICGLKVVWAL